MNDKPTESCDMASEEDARFMLEALLLAEEASRRGEIPIGCVIVQNGDIIARSGNTREYRQDATGHAEIEAIREACRVTGFWRLNDCDLYVTLEPCLMCAGAMIQARIRRCCFGAYDPKSGMAGSVANVFAFPSNHRVAVTGGVMEEACGDLLREFFAKRREEQKNTPQ
ncbi:MAG: tRNA adenosine(34) deaminase TadA [Saccharofermentanales bacterium]|jgi:tRNA(adenine34) deaminase